MYLEHRMLVTNNKPLKNKLLTEINEPRQALIALAMRNTMGRIERIITGVKTGVKVTVTVKVLMIKQKLKTLVSWTFKVIVGFKHCFRAFGLRKELTLKVTLKVKVRVSVKVAVKVTVVEVKCTTKSILKNGSS